VTCSPAEITLVDSGGHVERLGASSPASPVSGSSRLRTPPSNVDNHAGVSASPRPRAFALAGHPGWVAAQGRRVGLSLAVLLLGYHPTGGGHGTVANLLPASETI